MQQLISENGAKKYELVVNYRSKANIVSVANQWASQIPNRLKDTPIIAKDPTDGNIQIVQYGQTNLITPLVESIKATELAGSTCVLTGTNDEAAQITALLTKDGYAAKLIQSNDGFNLCNLQELRFFTDFVNRNGDSPIISHEDWTDGIRELNQQFQNSNKLEWCRIIIKAFELSNPARKYKSDWKAYLSESKFEDFIQINGETIYVSTIHKAKGKEFDNVFVVLAKFDAEADECKRQLYVAMTRAKDNLSIQYTQDFLSTLVANQLTYTKDMVNYEAPKYMTCLLTHRNVYLGYFAFVQRRMLDIYAGMPLIIKEEGLAKANGELLIRLSNKFKESALSYEANGYRMKWASINFSVFWKNPDNNEEVQILLPEVTFEKITTE
ncbi:MAG: hypothetical protein EOP48_23435 [Sphingobacteriales bacterium]|nr:MAG: hypothetical protein EOP48_23435 [Sphingobacteriales bacterium]